MTTIPLRHRNYVTEKRHIFPIWSSNQNLWLRHCSFITPKWHFW